MPTHLINLEARLTQNYVTGWDSEDCWVALTPARLNGPTRVSSSDEDSTVRHLLTFSPAQWAKARAVYQRYRRPTTPRPSFTVWLARKAAHNFATGCRCEHDCCGHHQSSASAVYIGRRRFSVEVHHYLNV